MSEFHFELTEKVIKDNIKISKDNLLKILQKVNSILDSEPKLVEIQPGRLFFIGDTHGNLPISIHACKHLFPLKNSIHKQFDKLIFLGDFIDRGPFSVENVNFLISMKMQFPDKIVLIRGNHETEEVSVRYGFYERIIREYGIDVFEQYTKLFSKLPLAVLTWNRIFAVHGGIPEGLESLGDINGLDNEVDPEDRITFQILWNDPVEKDGWFFQNFRGGYSKRFGNEAFKYFLEKHGVQLVLRAHEVHKGGYKPFFGDKLISLDTSDTPKKKNKYKVFIVEKTGDWRINEVEDFQDIDISKILSNKSL